MIFTLISRTQDLSYNGEQVCSLIINTDSLEKEEFDFNVIDLSAIALIIFFVVVVVI